MQDINPSNYLGIVILGVALLWAIRLVYGRRRGASNDLVKRSLLLAGWILIQSGLLGAVSLRIRSVGVRSAVVYRIAGAQHHTHDCAHSDWRENSSHYVSPRTLHPTG